MYSSYSFYSMKHKSGLFRSTYVSGTSSSNYEYWKRKVESSSATDWYKLCDEFAEDYQFSILLGVTITGMSCHAWDSIFRAVINESSPFQGTAKAYFQGQLRPDWRFFANKLAMDTYNSNYYPSICPEWLFPYRYSQHQYLADLAVYWDNIHDDYYKPWETTRIGEDSPEIARMKKLGQVARSEIDVVAKHSETSMKR